MMRWHAEMAWLDRLAHDVLIEIDGDRITSVEERVAAPPDAYRSRGLTIPGMANAHSHAFHRVLRGRTHQTHGTFWSWRELMYRVASRLEPNTYWKLARAVYAEMALAGVTAVGEFHYLHHQPDGSSYGDPNAMGKALIEAAREAGIRLTLLDTCYLRGGFDSKLQGAQVRFSDVTAGRWVERVSALHDSDHLRVGAAVHSVRAVDIRSMQVVGSWASEQQKPIHVHVSEQPAENEMCQRHTGATPTQVLADAGVLGKGATAIHATHLGLRDIDILRQRNVIVCLCPTTERDLADGVGPSGTLAEAGVPLCVGSDSHAVIDLFEEGRLLELHQRLITGQRGHHSVEQLWSALTATGMRSLGWDAGRITPGALADLVAVSLNSVRLAGASADTIADHVLYAANSGDVTDVIVGGEHVVVDGQHRFVTNPSDELNRLIERVVSV